MTQENSNEKQDNEANHEVSLDDQRYQNPNITSEMQKAVPVQASAKDTKEMEKVRKELDSVKKFIVTKYKFVQSIGIIPPQASEVFDEENELTEEERKSKPMHLIVVLPDDKEKEFNEIK